MRHKLPLPLLGAFLALLLITSLGLAQGRGRGTANPNAGGNGGRPAGVGQGSGLGVGGGLDNASIRSGGRSDDGLATANDRSSGRSMTGLERAEAARNNAARTSDTDLNRFRGLSQRFGTTPDVMRSRYQAALVVDPDLSFGQFVAATVVADNLHSRYPNVTSDAIIAAMANGQKMGQALKGLGVGDADLNEAGVRANAKIVAAGTNDTDLNRYRGLSRHLGVPADQLRLAYETALIANPKLTFGQFVAANVVADNLNSRYPGVTSDAIILAMADGKSLGSALRSLGVPKDEAEDANDQANDRIKAAKKNH